jgi:hypothetical protein
MEWHEMLAMGYGGILRTLEGALKGLTVEEINWQPGPDCNFINISQNVLTKAPVSIIMRK